MRILTAAAIAALALASVPAGAVALFEVDGGGYGQLTQPRNDDGFSSSLTLPFALNFFGTTYESLFVNNNGNVSFGAGLSQYTPTAFPIANVPMIAPFWGDVDTRNPSSGQVYIGYTGVDSRAATIVTWDEVGYYSNRADKLNSFQLVLIDRNDTGAGNFDIQFRYDQLQWTTGDASGGTNGLGGTPAQAGYDAGDGVNYFTLPGSRTSAVLALADSSNYSADTPGLWYFQIRNGAITDGGTPEAPLMPDLATPDGFEFTFDVVANTPVFIDPLVSVGYNYVVESGPNILSAWFGDVGDPDGYSIYGWDGSDYTIYLGDVVAEDWFDFGGDGVSRFGVRGISSDLGLDPSDPGAFVSGLTFATGGTVEMTMTPVTEWVGPGTGAVPEPATWAMMIAGFGLVGAVARRRRAPVAAA